MKKFFFEHCGHTLGHRSKRRMAEHRQLKFTIPVDKLSVGEEIEPVVNQRVERAQQPITFENSSLQKFSNLQFSGISKVVNQEIAHLPTIAHFLTIDTNQSLAIIISRDRFE